MEATQSRKAREPKVARSLSRHSARNQGPWRAVRSACCTRAGTSQRDGTWISYMLAPDEYRKGGYEASVSFYGETLGPEIVRATIRAAAHLP